jgi:hypothetical protein
MTSSTSSVTVLTQLSVLETPLLICWTRSEIKESKSECGEVVIFSVLFDFHFRQAIENFEKCVKPGGLLLIDHRNYDHIINAGSTPSKCIYYNVSLRTGEL